jgi:hypothetical protein
MILAGSKISNNEARVGAALLSEIILMISNQTSVIEKTCKAWIKFIFLISLIDDFLE